MSEDKKGCKDILKRYPHMLSLPGSKRCAVCLAAAVEIAAGPVLSKGLAGSFHLADAGTTRRDTTSVGGGNVASVAVEFIS